MNIEDLKKGSIIQKRIENLYNAVERIKDAVDNNKTNTKKYSLKINDVELFGGTSSLLYDCGFKDIDEVYKIMVYGIIGILENKRDLLEKEFEKL